MRIGFQPKSRQNTYACSQGCWISARAFLGEALFELGNAMKASGDINGYFAYSEQYIQYERRAKNHVSGVIVQTLAMEYVRQGNYERAQGLIAESVAVLKSGGVNASWKKDDLSRISAIQSLEETQALITGLKPPNQK
jgi:hypothetical protein